MAHAEYEMLMRLSQDGCAAGSYIRNQSSKKRPGPKAQVGETPIRLQSKEDGRPKSWSDPEGRHCSGEHWPGQYRDQPGRIQRACGQGGSRWQVPVAWPDSQGWISGPDDPHDPGRGQLDGLVTRSVLEWEQGQQQTDPRPHSPVGRGFHCPWG